MTYHRLSVVLVLLMAAAGVYVLLIPPVIGLANQADFARLMSPFGIAYPSNLTPEEQNWCFTDVHFVVTKPGGLGSFLSSQWLLVGLAFELNRFLSKSATFDIRILSTLELAVLLFLFWKLTGFFQEIRGRGRVAGVVLAALILSDVRYLAYFNTFYSEPGVFLFGIAFVVCLFRALKQPAARSIGYLTVSGILLVTSKPQYAPLAILIALFLVILPFLREEWHRVRWICVPAAVIVCGIGIATVFAPSAGYANSSLYNSVFSGLLYESDAPGEDLAALGIGAAAADYKGSSWFSVRRAGPELFPGTATLPKLFLFYLSHPKYLLRRTNRVLAGTWLSNELYYLGNFQRGFGYRCQEQTTALSLWDTMRSKLGHTSLLALFFLGTIPGGVFLGIRRKSLYAPGYVLLAVMSVASFYVAAIGDMIDARHLLLSNFLLDCCICCVVTYAVEPVLLACTVMRESARNFQMQDLQRLPGWRVLVPVAAGIAIATVVLLMAAFGKTASIVVRVTFAAQPAGVTEPILQLGASPGAADALAVIYRDGGRIVLFYDHWGTPRCESAPQQVRFDAPHNIELRSNGGNRSTSILLDGNPVMSCSALYNPDLKARVLGKNTFGFTTMLPAMSGRVELVSVSSGK